MTMNSFGCNSILYMLKNQLYLFIQFLVNSTRFWTRLYSYVCTYIYLILDLLKLAHQYLETRLQEKCELLITYEITTKNVLSLLTMAEEYHLKVSVCNTYIDIATYVCICCI